MTAAVDRFATSRSQIDAPYTYAEVVTKSDTVNLAYVSRAIYVGVAGDVTLVTRDGQTVTFKALPVGTHRIRASRINSTGTAATDMLALS